MAKQVKEKFGTLRFYFEGGDKTIRRIMYFASSISTIITENNDLIRESYP